jgi:hypothetical protein
MSKTAQTEKPKVEKAPEIISGGDIAGLFPAPSTSKILVPFKDKELEFEVMPLDNATFAQIGSTITINEKDLKLAQEGGNMAGIKVISDMYYPAIKVVLPKCCISPRVIDGVSTDPKVIPVDRLDLAVEILLLDKIMAISGLDPAEEQERKN